MIKMIHVQDSLDIFHCKATLISCRFLMCKSSYIYNSYPLYIICMFLLIMPEVHVLFSAKFWPCPLAKTKHNLVAQPGTPTSVMLRPHPGSLTGPNVVLTNTWASHVMSKLQFSPSIIKSLVKGQWCGRKHVNQNIFSQMRTVQIGDESHGTD